MFHSVKVFNSFHETECRKRKNLTMSLPIPGMSKNKMIRHFLMRQSVFNKKRFILSMCQQASAFVTGKNIEINRRLTV